MKRIVARGRGGSGGPAIRWGPRDGWKGTLEGGGTVVIPNGEFTAEVREVRYVEAEFGGSWMLRLSAPPFEGVLFISERYVDLSGMELGFYKFSSEKDPERTAGGRPLHQLVIESVEGDMVDVGILERFT